MKFKDYLLESYFHRVMTKEETLSGIDQCFSKPIPPEDIKLITTYKNDFYITPTVGKYNGKLHIVVPSYFIDKYEFKFKNAEEDLDILLMDYNYILHVTPTKPEGTEFLSTHREWASGEYYVEYETSDGNTSKVQVGTNQEIPLPEGFYYTKKISINFKNGSDSGVNIVPKELHGQQFELPLKFGDE